MPKIAFFPPENFMPNALDVGPRKGACVGDFEQRDRGLVRGKVTVKEDFVLFERVSISSYLYIMVINT